MEENNNTPPPADRPTRTRRQRTPPVDDPLVKAAAQAQVQPPAPPPAAPPQYPEQPLSQAPVAGDRPPIRAELRPDVESTLRAELRAQEILGHLGGVDEGTDEFYINPDVIPVGWDYNWKRRTVHGMEDPAYQVALQRTGWQPVPASRHPDMMPHNWQGNTIERKGQILMERPKVVSDMVRGADDKKARDQVRVKEQQLSSAPKGQMPRSADGINPQAAAGIAPRISKGYEPMPIPQK